MKQSYHIPTLTVHGTVAQLTAAWGHGTFMDMFYGPDPNLPGYPGHGSDRDVCTPPNTAPCEG